MGKRTALSAAEMAYIGDRWDRLLLWQSGELRMERNESSRLHRFLAAQEQANVFRVNGLPGDREFYGVSAEDADDPIYSAQSFLLVHDWSAAFGEAMDGVVNQDLNQPYPVCAFEMRISGVSLIGVSHTRPESWPALEVYADIGSDMWVGIDPNENVFLYASRQVQAALIAMDAQIADSELISPPDALNRKRIKLKKRPLPVYRVVRLARSGSTSGASGDGLSGRHPRLHFRRGHWRHYEDRKTWINWTLVGNPDLGFIDKHYKL